MEVGKMIEKAIDELPLEDCYSSYEEGFRRGAWWLYNHLWVSVEDDLPEFEKDVLVCNHGNGYEVQQVWFSHRTERKEVLVDKHRFADVAPFTITHWMEVPKIE